MYDIVSMQCVLSMMGGMQDGTSDALVPLSSLFIYTYEYDPVNDHSYVLYIKAVLCT